MSNKYLASILLCVLGCCFPGFVFGEGQKKTQLELIIKPGEHWLSPMWILFIPIAKGPQFAAWIEDKDGGYLFTIGISERSARQNWKSAPKGGRPESLPVWRHKRSVAETLDGVSSATPKGTAKAQGEFFLTEGVEYQVFLELNSSFDYNQAWTKQNSGVNGQPSVVYSARFTPGSAGTIPLAPLGRGSVDGSEGVIIPDLTTLTTARFIAAEVFLRVKGTGN
jgi:hypothetical protein